MLCPAVGDDVSVSLEHILVTETGTADVDAACVHPEAVVEEDGCQVAHVGLRRQRFVALGLKPPVAGPEARKVLDGRPRTRRGTQHCGRHLAHPSQQSGRRCRSRTESPPPTYYRDATRSVSTTP